MLEALQWVPCFMEYTPLRVGLSHQQKKHQKRLCSNGWLCCYGPMINGFEPVAIDRVPMLESAVD